MQQQLLPDIYDYDYSSWWSTFWPFIIAAVSLAALSALLGYWWWRRRRREAWQEALLKLQKLSVTMPEALFYERIIAILKDYCSLCYQLPVYSYTEEEFSRFAYAFLEKPWADNLEKLLARGHASKFARQATAHEERESDHRYSQEFIRHLVELQKRAQQH